MPLILLYIACVAAPLVVVAGLVMQIRARPSRAAALRGEVRGL